MKTILKHTDAWYNYRTEQYDFLQETPSDFSRYIPQDIISQSMYQLRLKIGDSPIDAAQKVLEAHLPSK